VEARSKEEKRREKKKAERGGTPKM